MRKWVDFDADMFDEIYNDDSQEREFAHKIYGYDNNPKANEIATHNIKAAGVSKDIVAETATVPAVRTAEREVDHHH